MNRKTVFFIQINMLLLATVLAACLGAAQAAKTKSLVGSWSVIVTTVNQGATFPALISFTSDGILLTDETPAPFETSGHGNWISTGHNAAAYAFEAIIGNEQGELSLRLKADGTVQYDDKTDTWSGPFNIVGVDADGNQLLVDTGTMSGTRILIP